MAKRVVSREEAESITTSQMTWCVWEDGGVVDEIEFCDDEGETVRDGQLRARYFLRNRNAGATPAKEGEFGIPVSVVRDWCSEVLEIEAHDTVLWYEDRP